MNRTFWRRVLLVLPVAVFVIRPLFGLRIGEIDRGYTWIDQVFKFVAFSTPAVRIGVSGSAILGLLCGLLGSFMVVRKISLMGDVLGHSILPGLVVGFLIAGGKTVPALLGGALVAGLVASALMSIIMHFSRIKQDAAMAIILSGFFGIGIVLLTRVQKMSFGNQSGLDQFLFGQASAMGVMDLALLLGVTLITVAVVTVCYRLLLVTSFDEGFAQAAGMPARRIHYLLMGLVTLATIVSIQAVGVVLVSAMLVVPAATAYLMTDRMVRMIFIASVLGMFSGCMGAFTSFLGPGLPTGPFMVLSASLLFVLAYFFAPAHGIMSQLFRRQRRKIKIMREHVLLDLYRINESGKSTQGISREEIFEKRNVKEPLQKRILEHLEKKGGVERERDGYKLSDEGVREARRLIKSHRVWENYLTETIKLDADHVHESAEMMEHYLDGEMLGKIEKELGEPKLDPHGKPIPQSEREVPG